MSKPTPRRQPDKRKVTVYCEPYECVVVGHVEQWRHLELIYNTFADQTTNPSERESWLDAAAWVRESIEYENPEYEDD